MSRNNSKNRGKTAKKDELTGEEKYYTIIDVSKPWRLL
jgi:hypothetical protein